VDHSDDKLIQELRSLAARADPTPERMLRAAKASYAWRTIDSELAELAYDSAGHDPSLAGVRGPGTTRMLSFAAVERGWTIELEVTPVADSIDILGQLIPAGHALLEVRHGGGVELVESDELGRFAVKRVQEGPVSIRCTRAGDDAPAVITDWTTL